MILIRHSAGIYKVCIDTAKLLRFLVHHICKGSYRSANLYTAHMPDPDLIIRPSGEIRTSNFLLWQSAYSEYYFTDVLWPDFKTTDLDAAIDNFNNRNRRFGGV